MDLLHPNLLTNEQIMALLKERQLDIPNIATMGREELVRLYKNFLLPQPCRRPRNKSNPENGDTECPDKVNGELKRKHNRITITEEVKPKDTHYKVKRSNSKTEADSTLEMTPKRKCSPEKSPPHTKRKKITWP
uniref:Protein aael aael007744 aedes aegypti n=1 Tax=Nyssomyia neivai TaxID=330878 RepID=A0A1L8DBE4_9DIPT